MDFHSIEEGLGIYRSWSNVEECKKAGSLTGFPLFRLAKGNLCRVEETSKRRAFVFNITNTPQYGYPSVPDITTATQQGVPFGQVTNTINTPRQFQFGARFSF
jgi:hypothetical protein